MKKITFSLILYLILGQLNFAYSQEKWMPHFENEQVKIEYRIADCNDRVNDTDFSFYVLRFENKTKKQLNVQFETAAPKNMLQKQAREEDFNSFILKPNQVLEGNCSSTQKELKQFLRENKQNDEKLKDKSLLILNVKTYEL